MTSRQNLRNFAIFYSKFAKPITKTSINWFGRLTRPASAHCWIRNMCFSRIGTTKMAWNQSSRGKTVLTKHDVKVIWPWPTKTHLWYWPSCLPVYTLCAIRYFTEGLRLQARSIGRNSKTQSAYSLMCYHCFCMWWWVTPMRLCGANHIIRPSKINSLAQTLPLSDKRFVVWTQPWAITYCRAMRRAQ